MGFCLLTIQERTTKDVARNSHYKPVLLLLKRIDVKTIPRRRYQLNVLDSLEQLGRGLEVR